MFDFLKVLTYDGTRGTVLRLEDLGNCFLMSVVYLRPAPLGNDECPTNAPPMTKDKPGRRLGSFPSSLEGHWFPPQAGTLIRH